jgi:uncharacterized peroxidase-related enzyme
MSWIEEISYERATGKLKKVYDRVKGPDNYIDNILSVHSLKPHTLSGHMALYKNVMHFTGNELPKWYREAIGIYVSQLNTCSYCVWHHSEGLRKLIDDKQHAVTIVNGLLNDELESIFNPPYLYGFHYAKKLTKKPGKMQIEDFMTLKKAGFSDGEILEINQIISYFNYANRTVSGLGVQTKGDIPGLTPGDKDSASWSHF